MGLMKMLSKWFSSFEQKEGNRIAERVYVGKCLGNHSVGELWKRWIVYNNYEKNEICLLGK